jgi:glycosyltransferase involved in cell wall biosynthesis
MSDYVSFYALAAWTALWMPRHDCLVVMSDPPLLSLLAVLVGTMKRCKVVCWMQDVFPDIAVRAGVLSEGPATRMLKRLAVWSLRRMDRVVVIGRCMEQFLLAQGVPRSKLACIPNWADGSQIQPVDRSENEFIRKHGLEDAFVVMYSGNFGVVHEFETLLASMEEMKSVPGVRFCFVGDGVRKPRLVDAAARAGWTHVMFLPYQPKEQLRMTLGAADVHLVSLRTYMEGLSVPSKVYGILAAARPVIFIGPEACEAAAVIREGGCGYVVRPGDSRAVVNALLECRRDSDARQRLGRASRQYFERSCSRPLSADRFLRLLQELCGEAGASPAAPC